MPDKTVTRVIHSYPRTGEHTASLHKRWSDCLHPEPKVGVNEIAFPQPDSERAARMAAGGAHYMLVDVVAEQPDRDPAESGSVDPAHT